MERLSVQMDREDKRVSQSKIKGVSFVRIGECGNLEYITIENPKPVKN